jgi:hypothetical protein
VAIRRRKFVDEPVITRLLERERLGLGRYRKVSERDPEERRLLIELALDKIREAEKSDYLPVEFRRRHVKD